MGRVRTQEKGKKINSKDEGGTSIYIYISDKLQFCLINSYNICIKLNSKDQTSDHLYKHLVSKKKKSEPRSVLFQTHALSNNHVSLASKSLNSSFIVKSKMLS